MQTRAPTKNDMKVSDAGDRSSHIDMMRLACVLVWVVRHGSAQFNESNIILDQNWAAPILWLISGMCWARSRTPFWLYMNRLAIYFVVGTGLNLFAWGMQTPIRFLDVWNIVYHMWFVAGLMVMTCITHPLKAVLEARAEEKNRAICWSAAPPCLLVCAATILSLTEGSHFTALEGLNYWLHGNHTTICLPLLESALFQSMAVLSFAFPPENRGGLTGWVLLLCIPGALVMYQHSRVGVELAAMNLFVLGVIVERQGLWGRLIIGKVITGYWLLIVLACGWLAIPLVKGTTDMAPSEDPLIRMQWSAITSVFLVAFLCAGDSIQDPLHIFDRFPGLKYWAALLYITHIAIHKLVPSPMNWMVLAASGLPLLLIRKQYLRANLDEAKPLMGSTKSRLLAGASSSSNEARPIQGSSKNAEDV